MATRQDFVLCIDQAVKSFSQNALCAILDQGNLKMENYHSILLMIFHQTFQGPSTFALAGAHCPLKYHVARDYLLHHADEEKSHWEWVISDLQTTGYTGRDPKELFPKTACQAYVAFNFYIAMRYPLARLGVAAVLESIGATFGKKYATQLVQTLQLKSAQAKFFFGHGDTDVGHTQDILKVIDGCGLVSEDWDWMCHAARTAGQLYKAMYDEAAKS